MSSNKRVLRPQRIFRAGTWTSESGQSYTYTPEQVLAIADSYDPSLRPANFVEGHPDDDQPGQGLVAAAYVDPDTGWLTVIPKAVSQNFATRFNSGHFNGWSASLLPPGHPDNPTPDSHYLKHVGAVPKGFQPGVKDQPVQQFCSPTDNGVINFYYMPEEEKPTTVTPPVTPSVEQFAVMQAEIDAAKTAIETQKAELAKQRAEMVAENALNKAQNFVEKNRVKLQGNEIPLVTDVLKTLYVQEATTPISFTSGDKTLPLTAAVEQLITNRPDLVRSGRLELENFVQGGEDIEEARQKLNNMHSKNLLGGGQ